MCLSIVLTMRKLGIFLSETGPKHPRSDGGAKGRLLNKAVLSE